MLLVVRHLVEDTGSDKYDVTNSIMYGRSYRYGDAAAAPVGPNDP